MPETQEHTQDRDARGRGWLLPPPNQNPMRAGLSLVPTPIGNMADITVRALDALYSADLIVCEDTRVTGRLLQYYDIKGKALKPYNDHSDQSLRDYIIGKIEGGAHVVLVSDAGSPLISDPGYKLVREVLGRNLPVTALPGANAVLPALQLSGLPSDGFVFAGFMPSKDKARKEMLARWGRCIHPVVFYETAPRLLKTLEAIKDVLDHRKVSVVREISKLYEEYRTDDIKALVDHYTTVGRPKGEIVLILDACDVQMDDADIDAALRLALNDMRVKQAAAHVAEKSGRSKSDLYGWALRIKDE